MGLQACQSAAGKIGSISCNGLSACGSAKASVGNDSCVGETACYFAFDTIGKDSCNGFQACPLAHRAVGDGSCNGIQACLPLPCVFPDCGLLVAVGKNSCNGDGACDCSNPKGHSPVVYQVGDNECNRKGVTFDGDPTCCVSGQEFPCECEETPGGLVVGTNTCASINRGFTSGTLKCNSATCQFDTSECTKCGNGAVEVGEECEGAGLPSKTCADLSFTSGTVTCNIATCKFDTSQCTKCGNGALEVGEECEGTGLPSKTCADLGFAGGGTLKCNGATCKFDTTGCKTTVQTVCGNALLEAGEECDGTGSPSTTCAALGFGGGGTLKCNSTTCKFDTSQCIACSGIGCFLLIILAIFRSIFCLFGLLC